MIFVVFRALVFLLFIFAWAKVWPVHAPANEITYPRYCMTIAIRLRQNLREEVSGINLVIKNASVIGIPRFPAGWGIKVQNYVDNTPTTIFGGATGSVAELRAEDLKCLFEIENGVPGTPPIEVSGNIAISTGEHERRVVLGKNQIVLEKINSSR